MLRRLGKHLMWRTPAAHLCLRPPGLLGQASAGSSQPLGRNEIMLSIRQEQAEDLSAIRAVNEQAFNQPEEADIVDQLRALGDSVLSLVATRNDEIVGHILFSPVTIEKNDDVVDGMGLGPMAVLPDFQGQRIGSALVEAGIRTLRDRFCPFVVVLGHPQYYPRFGFEPASRHGITCQWEEVPDDTFMALILDQGLMKNVSGRALYREEFG